MSYFTLKQNMSALPPIIEIFSGVPKGLWSSLKRKKNPFVTGEIVQKKEGRSFRKEKDLTWGEKHAKRCTLLTACTSCIRASAGMFLYPSEQLFVCLSRAWVAQLFKEGTNWERDLLFEGKAAVCLMFKMSVRDDYILGSENFNKARTPSLFVLTLWSLEEQNILLFIKTLNESTFVFGVASSIEY